MIIISLILFEKTYKKEKNTITYKIYKNNNNNNIFYFIKKIILYAREKEKEKFSNQWWFFTISYQTLN